MIVNVRPRTLRRRLITLAALLAFTTGTVTYAADAHALTDHIHTGVTLGRCWVQVPFGAMGGQLR